MYAVVLCVSATRSVDAAVDVALLVQNVECLQRNCCFALEEAIADLSIPNQFVSVHCCRRIATATSDADVSVVAKAVVEIACC